MNKRISYAFLGLLLSLAGIHAHAEWQTPILMEDSDEKAFAPEVAFIGPNKGVIVWMQSEDDVFRLNSRQLQNNGQWSKAKRIGLEDGSNELNASLEAGGSRAITVWSQKIYPQFEYRTAYRILDGNTWQDAAYFDAPALDNGYPDVAVNQKGNAIAVWEAATPEGQAAIWTSVYINDSWQTPSQLNSGIAADAWTPQIAFSDSGNGMIIWQGSYLNSEKREEYGLWSVALDANNAWQKPQQIHSSLNPPSTPAIAIDAKGEGFITWAEQLGDGSHGLIYQNFTATGWDAKKMVFHKHTSAFSAATVASNAQGQAVVVWNTVIDNSYAPVVSVRLPNKTFSAAIGLEDPNFKITKDRPNPKVAIAANGQAALVWTQNDGEHNRIRLRKYSPKGGWDAPETLIESGGVTQPRIAMDNDGNMLAAWIQDPAKTGDTVYDIWSQYYRNTAPSNPAP